MANRLAQSTSPYLLQHADNPVDWWEWGEDAFDEARRRNVPIFLSIGYSACHWCHVMAHESFEDDQTAALMNELYVCIKVDREERPDVDSIYMDATVAMTGQGGWPMSVFLDHEARPFYAGTYFPPQPRHGLPSFPQILTALSEAWTDRYDDVVRSGVRITEALSSRVIRLPEVPAGRWEMDAAVESLARDVDREWGGFGGAPKFPPSMVLEFLLRYHALTDDPTSLAMAERTLEAMARGGLYDQLGGGFARYSVDREWVVPHFEKMLYDNALLLRVYAHWWRLTGSPLAERVVRETAAFLVREMRTPEGGFAAALDADSDGVEGAFYAWSPEQLAAVLGEDDGRWAADLLSVTPEGTFEHGLSTLQMLSDPDDDDRWASVRSRLGAAREHRVRPGRDDKVVAAWNGLAIAALAEAGALFEVEEWVEAAVGAADLLVAIHLGANDDDRLVRTSRDGRAGQTDGVLDDYGDVADAFQTLFQVTGEDAWLVLAGMLLDVAIQHFGDEDGGFYDTADDAAPLIRRPRDAQDNAEPSGWLATANACITQAALTGVVEYRRVAERSLSVVSLLAERGPRAVGWGLAGLAALECGPLEVALVADDPDELGPWWRAALLGTSPGLVVAARLSDEAEVGLLHDRPPVGGRPTAYVCRRFACDAPLTDLGTFVERVGVRVQRG